MKKYLISLLLACNTYLAAAAWLPSAETIPLGSSVGANYDVTLAYFPKIKKVVAAWGDSISFLPYYSVYDGIANTWTTPLLIPSAGQVNENVNLQSFPFKKIVVGAWVDKNSGLIFSSYFDGTNWSSIQQIGTTASNSSNIGLTYDKVGHRVFAAWANVPKEPFYSIFDTSLSWQAPALLAPPAFITDNNVNLAYDKANNQVVAAWALQGSNTPFYAIFSGGTWMPPHFIPQGTSSGVFHDVTLVYDRNLDTVFAGWTDANNSTGGGYIASYNGAWTPATQLNLGASVGIYTNINFGYNLVSGVTFAAWQNLEVGPSSNGLPYYLTNSSPIGAQIPIPNPNYNGVNENVNLAYDQHSGKMVAAWAGFPDNTLIFYSTYQ